MMIRKLTDIQEEEEEKYHKLEQPQNISTNFYQTWSAFAKKLYKKKKHSKQCIELLYTKKKTENAFTWVIY